VKAWKANALVDKEYRDGSKVAGSLPPTPTGYRCGRMKRGGGCR